VAFPHVDVCLAIAWLSKDGRMVVGHVPAQWIGEHVVDHAGCAKHIMGAMDRLQGDRIIHFVVTLGDDNWRQIVDPMVTNLNPGQYLKIWKNVPGGADLRIDGGAGEIQVSASRTRQLIKKWPFAAVGKDNETVDYSVPALFAVAENLKSQFNEHPFKGLESITFHPLFQVSEQQKITAVFKKLFKSHGACIGFSTPLSASLGANVTYRFRDGGKEHFSLIVKPVPQKDGRFGITDISLRSGDQMYAEQHGRSMQYVRR